MDKVVDLTDVKIKKMAKKNPIRLMDSMDVRIKLTEKLLKAKFELEQEMRKPVNNYKVTLNTTPEQYKRMAKMMEWI